MAIDDVVKGADPHHIMLAGAGATIGYMGYLLAPAAYLSIPLLGPFAPALLPLISGITGYYVAKSVQD
ncbi:hypothetical protein HYY70_01460 [Candidatus Woesearchaeota archaeon]|nr:hypothetical protein [Candidatus Woesearchaeota archaeon]